MPKLLKDGTTKSIRFTNDWLPQEYRHGQSKTIYEFEQRPIFFDELGKKVRLFPIIGMKVGGKSALIKLLCTRLLKNAKRVNKPFPHWKLEGKNKITIFQFESRQKYHAEKENAHGVIIEMQAMLDKYKKYREINFVCPLSLLQFADYSVWEDGIIQPIEHFSAGGCPIYPVFMDIVPDIKMPWTESNLVDLMKLQFKMIDKKQLYWAYLVLRDNLPNEAAQFYGFLKPFI